MDLVNDLNMLIQKLNTSIKTLAQNGRALAEAERDYKITLRQEALKLRNEKDMPVTLINQVIYGVPEVADKRFKRDVAEAMYNTNQEYINTTKLQIRILENQLAREFGNTR
jgi:chromosome condensin MukBEF complex kleisin-like MukF subunit